MAPLCNFIIFIRQIMQEIPSQKNNPLHGITLEKVVTELQAHYGWKQLGEIIAINCFTSNPSIKSSLTFLRKTPWARKKVEDLWVRKFSSHKD
jgi:uncharacterized protein (DUF2132 family)